MASLWYESWCAVSTVRAFTSDYKFRIRVTTKLLLNLLTFIAIQILQEISIYHRWFLFGVSYYVNFQFTLEEQLVDNIMVTKIWVGMSTANMHLLQFIVLGL